MESEREREREKGEEKQATRPAESAFKYLVGQAALRFYIYLFVFAAGALALRVSSSLFFLLFSPALPRLSNHLLNACVQQ
jgi:hypothetical protein